MSYFPTLAALFSTSTAVGELEASVNWELGDFLEKKSRIRETKHLSTDADSSTDAIVG
jgi:hypothetical protein